MLTASRRESVSGIDVDGSRPAVEWITGLPGDWLSPGERLVMLVVACDSYDGLSCRPGNANLSRWAGMSESYVRDVLRNLAEATVKRPALIRREENTGRKRGRLVLLRPSQPADSLGGLEGTQPADSVSGLDSQPADKPADSVGRNPSQPADKPADSVGTSLTRLTPTPAAAVVLAKCAERPCVAPRPHRCWPDLSPNSSGRAGRGFVGVPPEQQVNLPLLLGVPPAPQPGQGATIHR